MKQIPLSRGMFATVDDSDFEWLSQWKWYAHKRLNYFYAARNEPVCSKKQKQVSMHRVILNVSDPNTIVDHKDGNTLNNCRNNIRICSKSQNNMNKKLSTNNSSGFKGVCWFKPRKRWAANISINKKHICIGYFKSKEEAAQAYAEAAKKYHGEFANLGY